MTDTTRDRLLGGKVVLKQPKEGLRATTDAILLAAAVRAGPADHVLDLGCGAGAALFCLAARVPGCRITGLERDKTLAGHAATNAALNKVEDRVTIVTGSVPDADMPQLAGPFDQVMTNPPYLPPGRSRGGGKGGGDGHGDSNGGTQRQTAMVEGVDLPAWLDFGLQRLRPRGVVTLVHRADRLDDLLGALAGRAGDITVFPLWADDDRAKPARRVLVRARKGVRSPLRLLPGLVLHGTGGAYTPAAERLLRDGEALSWS